MLDVNNNIDCTDVKIINKQCVAKFYCYFKGLKISDVVDVYGIWYPSNTVSNDDEKKDNNDDNSIGNVSDMGFIHVIYYNAIPNVNDLCVPSPGSAYDELFNNIKDNLDSIRSELIGYIASYFNNDRLVAEYILLQMISKLLSKRENIFIGNLNINIKGIKSEFECKKIRHLCEELLPKVSYLDVNINNLKKYSYIPVKNNETQRLQLNQINFQFPNDTCLILNTINLNPGQLNDIGIKNVKAIHTLITEQKVNYDFKYYTIPFDAKVSVLVLSNKNTLKQFNCECTLKVNDIIIEEMDEETSNNNSNNSNNITSDKLMIWRQYIHIASSFLNKFTLTPEVSKVNHYISIPNTFYIIIP